MKKLMFMLGVIALQLVNSEVFSLVILSILGIMGLIFLYNLSTRKE